MFEAKGEFYVPVREAELCEASKTRQQNSGLFNFPGDFNTTGEFLYHFY